MSKLKIAFFSDMLMRDYDGCMRTVFHIIDRKPEDVEIKYFCGQGTVKGLNKPVISIPNVVIPFNNNYKMALPVLAKQKIKRELEEFQPDVVHITSPSMLGNYALQLAKEKLIPVSTIYHTHYISYINYYLSKMKSIVPLAEHLIRNSTRNFYNNCDLVLVPTEEMVDVLEQVGVRRSLMTIWKRGIERRIFNTEKSDRDRIKQMVGNDHFNILFASRLVWEKNLQVLIDVYKQAEKENLKVNFLLAGDGTAYQSMVKQMPKAIFLGNVDQNELGMLYASSDVFLFPSISETYGNVVLEAMASGLPCVIANGGGSKHFVNQGVNGFLCKPFDIQDYIDRIKILMNDGTLRQDMIDNALSYAQGFDWDVLTLRFYNQLKSISANQKAITSKYNNHMAELT